MTKHRCPLCGRANALTDKEYQKHMADYYSLSRVRDKAEELCHHLGEQIQKLSQDDAALLAELSLVLALDRKQRKEIFLV